MNLVEGKSLYSIDNNSFSSYKDNVLWKQYFYSVDIEYFESSNHYIFSYNDHSGYISSQIFEAKFVSFGPSNLIFNGYHVYRGINYTFKI